MYRTIISPIFRSTRLYLQLVVVGIVRVRTKTTEFNIGLTPYIGYSFVPSTVVL